jgi:superfamily I DNA/RNA helicase
MDEQVLNFTYRNPKNILRTSMGFYINRFRNSPTALVDNKVKFYNTYPGEVSLIHTINEINTIDTLIKNRAENTVGILLPNNAAVKLFYDALEDRNLEDIEYKYYIGGTGENTCDFENTRPKIMTYHSAKGIQFDSVIIPLLDGNYSDEIRFSNEPEEARAFYVAMTRTRKNLYFTMPPEAICPYYEVVPKDYMKIVQRDEDPTPTVDDLFEIPKADDIIDFGEEDD